ncbi:hypothetical protein WJX74_004997 [Apatococcus lobatus]|uniref:Uncharacterized protein n=1 Tax=Apatococcus lobatus TaxID=904363 RepID=A0AAW1Q762_9CHLO
MPAMASRDRIRVLPLIRKVTLFNEAVCRSFLQRVCKLLPGVAGDIDWSGGDPTSPHDTAACVVWLFLGQVTPPPPPVTAGPLDRTPPSLTSPLSRPQVGAPCKRARLHESGVPSDVVDRVAAAMAGSDHLTLFHTKRPSAGLAAEPLLLLTGLPADMRPRELRLMVCSLPSFRAAALALHDGVPMGFVWFDSQVAAKCALVALKHLILDAACPCSMRVTFHETAARLPVPPLRHLTSPWNRPGMDSDTASH